MTTSTDTSVEVLTTELRRRGERVTTARLAVAEVLAGTEEHLSAEQIALRAEELRPGIHRATVYRALDALGELGLVMHVHLGKAGTTYHLAGELAQEHQEHLHVRCTECGAVLDVDGKTLDPVRRKLQRDLGFHLDPEHVALLGICQDCSAS